MGKDLVKHNINFLEYPLWFQNDRLAQTSEDGMVWTDQAGYVYRAGYKPPVKTDAIFLLYLLMMSQRNDYAETLTISRYKILTECGFGVDAGWYSRLEESLKRWKMVGIMFEGTFYDGKVYKAMNFGIIDSWEIQEKNKRLKIWFAPRFLEMMRGNGFFKFIKFSEFKQLKSSLATRLYEILSKSFYLGDTFEIEAVKLAEKIPMKERYPAHIIPKIRAAIAQINKNTDNSFHFEARSSEKAKRKKILRFQKHAKETRRQAKAPEETSKEPLVIPESDEMKALIALLPPMRRKQKTILKIIVAFYQRHGPEYVARNIEYACEHSTSNFRPYLLKALRHDYGLAWKEDRELLIAKEQNAHGSKAQQDEELHRQKREEAAQDQAQEYIESLSPDQKAKLEQEAIASLDENLREAVLRKAPGSKILVSLTMKRLVINQQAEAAAKSQPDLPGLEVGP